MNDLYEAIGSIAAAAHANGNTIDENIRPEDNHNVEHGFDIFREVPRARWPVASAFTLRLGNGI
jgi:hypothetical protein